MTSIFVVVVLQSHSHHYDWRRLQVHESQSERQRKSPMQKALTFSKRADEKVHQAQWLLTLNCFNDQNSKELYTVLQSLIVQTRSIRVSWHNMLRSHWQPWEDPHKYSGPDGYKAAFLDGIEEFNRFGHAAGNAKFQIDPEQALELYGMKVA